MLAVFLILRFFNVLKKIIIFREIDFVVSERGGVCILFYQA